MPKSEDLNVGHPGNVKAAGLGESDLDTNFGNGYSVYHLRRGEALINLMAGRYKRSQNNGIDEARLMGATLKRRPHEKPTLIATTLLRISGPPQKCNLRVLEAYGQSSNVMSQRRNQLQCIRPGFSVRATYF